MLPKRGLGFLPQRCHQEPQTLRQNTWNSWCDEFGAKVLETLGEIRGWGRGGMF